MYHQSNGHTITVETLENHQKFDTQNEWKDMLAKEPTDQQSHNSDWYGQQKSAQLDEDGFTYDKVVLVKEYDDTGHPVSVFMKFTDGDKEFFEQITPSATKLEKTIDEVKQGFDWVASKLKIPHDDQNDHGHTPVTIDDGHGGQVKDMDGDGDHDWVDKWKDFDLNDKIHDVRADVAHFKDSAVNGLAHFKESVMAKFHHNPDTNTNPASGSQPESKVDKDIDHHVDHNSLEVHNGHMITGANADFGDIINPFLLGTMFVSKILSEKYPAGAKYWGYISYAVPIITLDPMMYVTLLAAKKIATLPTWAKLAIAGAALAILPFAHGVIIHGLVLGVARIAINQVIIK